MRSSRAASRFGNRLSNRGFADRLFPSDPQTRGLARDLYESVANLPIISPHGHVDPTLLLKNEAFADPVALFLRHDHYVTRLLHADGLSLEPFLTAPRNSDEARVVWREFASRWHLFAGTASSYWLSTTWRTQFGLTSELNADNADEYYDRIAQALATPEFRPAALFNRFNIEVLATTDSPLDSLDAHRAIKESGHLTGRVLPTFRPDAFTDPEHPDFIANLEALAATTNRNAADAHGYLESLRDRRQFFIQHGAVSADHGVAEATTMNLDKEEFAAIYADALSGNLDRQGARIFRAAMLVEMAKMSADDGLVMTIHPGVFRNHSSSTFAKHGPDTGHDIPVAVEYTHNLRPLLEEVGLRPTFKLVLFSIDETVYSREIAPLAGFYPSVYIGAPWWFLDAPDAARRAREAITETAGFSRGSGFIDDTRAFLSIPARHDMARRTDAGFLARLVAEGRLSEPEASRIIIDSSYHQPKRVFNL